MPPSDLAVSTTLTALQVIGLFLPVVIVAGRFTINHLEPSSGVSRAEKRELRERQAKLVRYSFLTIMVLSASSVLLLAYLLLLVQLPPLVNGGIALLGIAFIIFPILLWDAITGSEWIL